MQGLTAAVPTQGGRDVQGLEKTILRRNHPLKLEATVHTLLPVRKSFLASRPWPRIQHKHEFYHDVCVAQSLAKPRNT